MSILRNVKKYVAEESENKVISNTFKFCIIGVAKLVELHKQRNTKW
jgi:hypothetical protein